MGKEVTILGKFYLRNGNVIEEKVVLDKDNSREDIDAFVKELKDIIKTAFRENIEFQFTFGFTMFKGSELVAATITEQ